MGKYIAKNKDDREIKILTLDTETRGLDGEIFRIGIFDGENYFYGNSFSDLKNKLLSYRYYNTHIYIHNLKFDLSKLIQEISGRIIWRESLFIMNKPAIIKTLDYTLHDSLILMNNVSLENLCKDFKIKNAKKDLCLALWEDPAAREKYIVMKEKGIRTFYDRKNDKIFKLLRNYNQNDPKNIDKKATLKKYFELVDPDDPLLNDYLEFDCRSLYEIIENVMKVAPIDEEDFLSCPTSASLSMKTYSKHPLFKKFYKLACKGMWEERNNQIEEIMKAGYYGGRTEVFKPFLLKRGYHYDVNSLYPFAMSKPGNKFPIGEAQLLTGIRARAQWLSYTRKQKGGGIVEATVYSPKEGTIGKYPILPLKHNGKLIFPRGEFTGTWTLPELFFAQQRGVKILEIHNMVYFWEVVDLFTDFVNYFKKLKEDNSPNGDPEHDAKCNPTLRSLAKTILNSLYGKFATKRERDSFCGFQEVEDLIEELEKKKLIFEPEIKFFKDFISGGYDQAKNNYFRENTDPKIIGRMPQAIQPLLIKEKIFQWTTYLTARYIQIQISAYVTSYARMELYLGFENVIKNGGEIYYVDTDSMVSDVEIDPELKHPTEFGKWELEGKKKRLTGGRFYQPKSYLEVYEEEKTPETAKFNMITIYYPGGKTLTRWLDISQKDVTSKFKGIPKDIAQGLTMGNFDYYMARQQKQDTDKIEIVTAEHDRKNLISLMVALKQDKDPNTMIEIKKSIKIAGSVQKRKFDYDKNISTPWAVDPADPDFINDTKFEIDAWNDLMSLENNFNKYDLGLMEYGKMQPPGRKDPKYNDYMELPAAIRKKYFKRNGSDRGLFAEFIEIHPDDIFYDMKWYFRRFH